MSQKPEVNMCQLSQMTPAQLNAMTKAQLIAAALDGVTETVPVAIRLEDGRLLNIEETTKDAYGVVKGSRKIDWTYFVAKQVNEIITTEFDAKAQPIRRSTVHHSATGAKQPWLTVEALAGEMPVLIGK